MSNIRLFYSGSLSLNLNDKLNKSQSHYINKVMRIKIKECFSLFNENGEWEAKITRISNGIVEFVITVQKRQKENRREIWLAFSPIKSNYFNFMIQKATELGVTKFIPINSDRTIVRKINIERFKKIMVESCEQSNRLKLPIIENVVSLKNFINQNDKIHIIFGDINTSNTVINIKNLSNLDPVCILIGPEGDFTEKEREQILKMKKIQPLKINENILRSETAAISTLSIVNYTLNL